MAETKNTIKNLYIFGAKYHNASLKEILSKTFKEEMVNYKLTFLRDHLDEDKLHMVIGADALVCTVRDKLNAKTLEAIGKNGIRLIVFQSQNGEGVDVIAAEKNNIQITYCPYYIAEAIAEHAMAMLLTVNRHINQAYNRVREGNFELDGLLGMDLHGKTMGILGFGKIGRAFSKICIGFGMKVLVWNRVKKNEENLKVEFAELEEVLSQSDVISLHLGLNEETKYIINEKTIAKMKDNAFLINTARGKLIKSEDLLKSLLAGKFSGVGLDVCEDKHEVFFRNMDGQTLLDEVLARLITIQRVLITSRMAWFTKENIILEFETIFKNLKAYNTTGRVIDSVY